MTTLHPTAPQAGPTTGRNPADETVDLAPENHTFLQQIAQEIHSASPQTWKRHWKARYGLPPHPQFVRFLKSEAPTLSPTELLRHLDREHRLEASAQGALRPDFRHTQPDRYRVLLREVREGLRDTFVLPAPPPHRVTRQKKQGSKD